MTKSIYISPAKFYDIYDDARKSSAKWTFHETRCFVTYKIFFMDTHEIYCVKISKNNPWRRCLFNEYKRAIGLV